MSPHTSKEAPEGGVEAPESSMRAPEWAGRMPELGARTFAGARGIPSLARGQRLGRA